MVRVRLECGPCDGGGWEELNTGPFRVPIFVIQGTLQIEDSQDPQEFMEAFIKERAREL